MVQTECVRDELKKIYPSSGFEIKTIKTVGDKIPDVALAKIGDKGLFTKEIEEALLKDEIDLAVHSMKDLPTELPLGLEIAAMTKREDPRDILASKQGYTIKGAKKAFELKDIKPTEIDNIPEVKKDVVLTDKQRKQVSAIRQELLGLREKLRPYIADSIPA